jgi:hypothetical protein
LPSEEQFSPAEDVCDRSSLIQLPREPLVEKPLDRGWGPLGFKLGLILGVAGFVLGTGELLITQQPVPTEGIGIAIVRLLIMIPGEGILIGFFAFSAGVFINLFLGLLPTKANRMAQALDSSPEDDDENEL